MRPASRRLAALVALAAVIAAGLVTHLVLPPAAATDIAGDALYAGAAYAGVVMLFAWRPVVAASVAAAWCVAVELFQLTGVPLAAGLGFPPAKLLLGTGFDPRDLIVYVLAAATAGTVDAALAAVLRHRRAVRPRPGEAFPPRE